MSKRYIDADKLAFSRVRIIHPDGTVGGWNAVVMSSVINNAPTADVVEVRHGHWISEEEAVQLDRYDLAYTCSVCGRCDWDCTESKNFNFCPNCGAKMDGERRDSECSSK